MRWETIDDGNRLTCGCYGEYYENMVLDVWCIANSRDCTLTAKASLISKSSASLSCSPDILSASGMASDGDVGKRNGS